MQQTTIHDLPDDWAEIDAWRSIFYAMAAVNGGDPDVAAARHRAWSIRMGFEPSAPEGDD